uniref:Beta expansin 2 n=1 Tax=Solanum tuberosum TaxID=4113 RepID=M1BMI7_SOLTU
MGAGGSCGYGSAVSQAPFSSFVTGIGPSLYKSGKECGACYQVKCTKKMHGSCSGKGVRVVITDFCPGGPCVAQSAHFDLSGTAFGSMAIPGQEQKLRDAGVLQILVIEFEEGDGDLAKVELKEKISSITKNSKWRQMQQSWGAVWKLDAGSELHPPFSIRLTSQYSDQILIAKNVIPTGWQPGATYRSLVNYRV